jgi:DNA-binding protein HU-beta
MSNSLTKAELISAIASEAGLKKVEAERAIAALTGTIQGALHDGRKVTLVGFGTFSIAERAERVGTHPQTRQRMTIPSSKSVRFRPGKAMREAVND